ncbi:peptidoglycan-binding protein [Alcaligenes aquatilis]|uniref:peptidoglycan-binding domain-containing protein n=1 Tax=Alcaligenes aquatilis TaxID=323284 RepID=UPI001ABB5CD6|nr:peptidoglycan-binding domain-containing protein [Alcaligenes aquatilis]QXR35337.1 peptidoglycan-binding protein [Alcaligenes aquatilis]
MTGGEEKPKNGEGKGFAGLSSLVSDVDTTPPPAAKKEPTAAPSAPRPAPQPTQPQPPPTQHQTHQAPAQPSSDSSGGKWLLGIIAVIGVIIWLASHSDNTGTSTTPVYDPSKQASNFDQDEVSKKSSESEPPKFSDYLSEPYDGPRASVNLVSDFDKNFRTRIRGTQSQPVNFAGEYVLSTWGCGTSCSMGVAVSSRTGRVVALPGTACCWKGEGERVIFKKNSRLLVLAGLINEGGKYGAHFYELKNDQFVHVKTIVVKEDDSGPASSAESAPQAYPSPSTSQQAPSRPTEAKPPVGQNLVLSREQIRYCLAEDIRMDGAKSAINNYIDADVARFNAMVADYNSRCSSFQYQTNNRGRNDLNSAQRDIEPFRNLLQSEGRSRFARAPTGSLSTPEAARPASNATVQAIQRKLNELGYEAGAADGLMGRRTRSAISAFQRDSGLVADGNATAALLQFLTTSSQAGRQEAQPPASSVAVAPPAYTPPARTPSRQESASPNSHGIPQNAHLNYLGNGWECNRGFYRAGNECRPVQAPQNASLNYLGNGWECNRGYYRAGNECAPVRIPANASLNYLGNGWECNQGFRKAGDKCVSIFER